MYVKEKVFSLVSNCLKDISPCHGYEHAMAVYNHAVKATEELKIQEKELILYAALLHDIDDPKFFKSKDCENAISILKEVGLKDEEIKTVVEMINLVSSSKNGDRVPESVKGKEWKLIPRWCDRLEAIGKIGIQRCATFRKNVTKAPFFASSTPRPKDMEELSSYVSVERYKSYKGESLSMIDHYFDKLLLLGSFECNNNYIKEEVKKRNDVMSAFVLWAVKNEKDMSDSLIDDYLSTFLQN
jgi:uncharacterized protein